MFTPIKNLITYIQKKNASGTSIFGGNSGIEQSTKMDTNNLNTETLNADMQTGSEIPKEIDKEDNVEKKLEEELCEESKATNLDAKDTEINTPTLTAITAVSTENSCDYEDDDIEAQIESSIMLKKPVKDTATNSSEILELRKSSNTNCNIVISHDFNRNLSLCPTDDELEDFRHDPTEVLVASSSPRSNQPADEFCSIGDTEEEELEKDLKTVNDFPTEDEGEDLYEDKAENEQKLITESEAEPEEEKDIETENDAVEVEDDEAYLDLENFKNNNVIVMDEVDLNTSTASVDTSNTADDPLAIPCEEQEAFAADKTAALEELNLLNTSQNSQDDDTRTTTDEDLRWLKSDNDDNQPSCSNKILLKNTTSEILPEKEERNGEGSDSGLGSETSALHTTTTSITDSSHLNVTAATPIQTPTQIKIKESEEILNTSVLRLAKSQPKDPPKPYRSNLKRRLEVDVVEGLDSLASTGSSFNENSSLNGSIQKKAKRSINFDTVQVYYFPRQQGFCCVPSAGGCTLGMGARHVAFKTLTLAEHAAELRRAHRLQLQEINPRGSSSDDSEESEEDYLSEGSGSDLDGESNGFLQPVSPKQRRALLKAAGIRKIDPSEKADCRNIRNSREVCGCSCRDFCDPETCACSQSGIKCQVDRDMFPCGCSRDACGNTIGRVEFNPTRVRTHYIHTLMRLEMENRQQQNPYASAVVSPIQTTPSSFYQTHLQSQSNYSSGYASPAYNTASEIHQQTAASSYYHTQNPSTSNGLYGQQTSLEMTHNGGGTASTTAASAHYGIDSLDSSLFCSSTATTPSYGELMPMGSYHYGNVQAQAPTYSSYHNSYHNINANNNNTSPSTTNTFSSCAVPSIPPFGAATTTEATGVYHSVDSLASLETTTAPSCSVNDATSLESDASSSFISLSTPLASSSRLSQINDLLQHNRNATTALVAISQNVEESDNKSDSAACLTLTNTCISSQSNSLAMCPSDNTPHSEDVNKSCLAFENLVSPLKPTPVVTVSNKDDEKGGPDKITLPEPPAETLTKNVEDSATLFNTEFLAQTSFSEDDKDMTTLAVSASIEPSTIEVAAGN